VTLPVVEKGDGVARSQEVANWLNAENVIPTSVAIGGVAAEKKEGTRSNQGEDLVVPEREIRLADVWPQVPLRVPVGEFLSDSPFAADCDFDPLIERRQEKSFFPSNGMSDAANSVLST